MTIDDKIKLRLVKALGFEVGPDYDPAELMFHAAIRIERLKSEAERATEQQVPGEVR